MSERWQPERGWVSLEARCDKCGEIFNPVDGDDLEHLECGGRGEPLGAVYDEPARKTSPWGEPVCEKCGGIGPASCICDIQQSAGE